MGTFTGQASARGRRGADQADPFKPILTLKNDIVPGQVIIQLRSDAAEAITESIGGNSSAVTGMAATKNFGVSALDKALANLKVISITRLHPPAPPEASGERSFAAEVLGTTFRVHYEAKTAPEKVVETMTALDGVEFVEAVRLRETLSTTPNDPQFPSQWGLRRIHCPDAWDRTRGVNSIVVAVIDTGVDLDHPELAPLLVAGRDFVNLGTSPTPPPGFHFEGDFNTVDNDPMDEVGHGTHVAGTICCLSNNAAGVAGVTWDCRIMPVRVLARIVNNTNPSDVRGTGSSADIAAGIRWAVDHGARVINLSLGGPSDTFVERDAIAYAVAQNVVVCAAMGNAFLSGNPTSYPGAYPDVVAVGAIDNADRRASFSQTGPHIDISGPGVGVLSTVWNNGFTTMSGTSMATPHVAGVAALVLSIRPSLTAAQCADILRQSADPLRDAPGDPVPNNNYGWGCVNALAAVNRASPAGTNTLLCPSRAVVCVPTSPITCVVQTSPIACPPHTIQLTCPSQPIVCQLSQAIVCHSQPIQCPISTLITCATSRSRASRPIRLPVFRRATSAVR